MKITSIFLNLLSIGMLSFVHCAEDATVLHSNDNMRVKIEGSKIFEYHNISVGVTTVFSSITVQIKALDKSSFKLIIGNRSEFKKQSLWQKGLSQLFHKEKGYTTLQKISPFHNLHMYVQFADGQNHTVDVNVERKGLDTVGVVLFLCGIMLFNMARTLSRSTMFHYTSGASMGIMMSFMVLLILLYKLLPYKKVIGASMATGFSITVYFMEYVWNKLLDVAITYPYHTATFCSISGLVSVVLMYYFGPPSHERSFNLIQWFLQLVAVYLIYQSSYCKEFVITVIVLVAISQFISFTRLLYKLFMHLLPRSVNLWLSAPPQRRLLSLEEYQQQGVIETEKALKELAAYCSSPKCNSWEVVSKLKTPKKFAEFLQSGDQFTTDELDAYEIEDFSNGSIKIDDDEQPSLHLSQTSSVSSLSNGRVRGSPQARNWMSEDDTMELLTD